MAWKNVPLLYLFFLIFILSCSAPASNHLEESQETILTSDPVIMAYYVAERDYKPENIPVEKLTHIIYSFTNVIDGEMKFRNEEAAGPKLEALVKQKERNPDLKVMIACGGWGADGFSDMALTEESRAKFIQSASEFISNYQLDGMDMDWEYPGISGAGTMAREEDTKNFTALMKGLREMLDSFDSPKILTFASAGWKRYYDHIEVNEVMKYADYTNVMTYDQVSGVSIYTGHHTPLGDMKSSDIEETPFQAHLDSLYQSGDNLDPDPRSAEKIVNFLIQEGVDPKQIVIGSAFYGRVWKGVPSANNGLYQLSSGLHIGWMAYHQIREKYEPDSSFKRFWDEKAQAPYMYHVTDSLFVSYDDTVSVALKTKYTMEKGLGGIMFWELGNDTKEEGSLLDAIYKAANE
ncbi:glycoside hydrolase family 18 protein [Algoriphagus sp. D3-2-R+10]|uniref:glycoside hydrolase family 18 protein n=1 Tax=Algoriphagus aurantiacus TaxID=3103948 RepID=UPI002B378836|nr:glycoside hydrolase family 18 protein [Algoriphagus sp. D3-2-R+10]MEB2775038.1 glycoside hydrolase family 18 protein [Algoriphagus sp. D3-2-R+10]